MKKKDRVVRPSDGTFTVSRLLSAMLAGAMLLTAAPENNLFAQTDFGDAPESYGTLLTGDGARHVVLDYDPDNFTSSLMLGSLIDAEPDGFPSAGADGDDADNVDDEDAFNVMPPININSSEYTVEVPVHNSTGAGAVLVGWIDFNRNGQFDPDEAVATTVADGQTTATLSWTGLSLGGQFGSTYARLRLAPADEIDIDTPTGEAAGGEVEDYTVPFVSLAPPFLDCPVTDEPPPTDFSIQLRWQSPDVAGQRTLTYQTPIVGDLFGNGQPVVVVPADNNYNPGASVAGRRATDLHLFNGADGSYISTIATPLLSWSGHASAAIADLTGDGQGEIIVKANHANGGALAPYNRRLVAYAYDAGDDEWNELWVSDEIYDYGEGNSRAGGALGIADFNGDGVPEVYVGNQIFNAVTGERLAARASAESTGCPHRGTWGCFVVQTTAVDMDGDGQLELVAGNVVYKVDLDHPDPLLRLTVWQQADPSVPGVGDGLTAVADMDLDGTPDVVVVRTNNNQQLGPTVVYVWDGQTGTVKGMLNGGIGSGGGSPMIGDIDGDGAPEIVVANSFALRAFDLEPGTGLVEKWTLATNDGSGITSLAMFDFNKDQVMELVYRDEQNIRIIDGSGAVAQELASFACTSGTGTEMPVIAALDGTRQARILATCGTVAPLQRGVVRAFETASFPWANTRPVWNQQAYFVAHINDDLSVPSNQFPHWTPFNDAGQQCSDGVSRPLNAFQQQVTDIDPNSGCPVECAPALVEINKELTGESGEIDGQAEAGELLTYTITLTNSGGQDAENQQIWDQLDANVSFVGADTGGEHDGSATGGVVEWTGLLVPGDDFIELTVTVQVVDPIPDGVLEIGNVAYAPIQGPPDCDADPLPPNCTLMPTGPNVGIVKTLVDESGAVDGQAEAGETLTYEITLTNIGGSVAVGYPALDQLDPNVTFVSADNGGMHDGSATGGEVNWTVDVPAADDNGPGLLVLTVVVQVADPIPDGVTEIGNVAYNPDIGPPDCDIDPRPPECSGPLPTEPNVSIEKDLVAEDGEVDGQAEAGEMLTYEITLTNTGGDPAPGYEVVDQLDPNVVFVSADNGGVHDGAATGGQVNWTVNVPAADDNGPGVLVLTVVVQVVDPVPDGVMTIGNVAYNPDDGPPVCPDPACTVIPTEPQLSVEKSIIAESGAMNGIAEAGEVLTFSIRVRNTGGSDAADVLVNEAVPDDTTYEATGSDVWGCADGSPAGTACDLVIPVVPAGGHIDLLFRVRVDDPIPPGVVNIANSVALNDEDPPDCPPTTDPACVVIPTEPQTVISKALTGESLGQNGQAEAGEVLTYTLTLHNHGGLAENNVLVNEIVPEYTVSATGNQFVNGALGDWSCADGSGPGAACDLLLDSIGPDETVELTFMVQVDDPIPDGVAEIANSVALNGEDPVPCPPAGPQCVITPTEPAVSVIKTLFSKDGEVGGAAEAGEILIYELTVTNSGGSTAFDEFLREIVPQHTTYVAPQSSTGWDCPDGSPTPAVCDLFFDIDGGQTLSFLFAVQVVDPLPDDVTHIANGIGLGGNPTPCPPGGVHCVVVPTTNLFISKALVGESGELDGVAEAGETLTYEITLTNTGGADAVDYPVVDQLDPNVIFVSADMGGTHDGAPAGGQVNWTVDVPAADDEGPGIVVLTVEAQVVDPIPDGATEIGNAAYNPDFDPPDCDAGDPPPSCSAPLPTEPRVSPAKALVGESGNIDGVAEAGEQLTYAVTLTNTGGTDAIGYQIIDQLDPNVVFVSADNGGVHDGAASGGQVNWTVDVPAGADVVLTVVVEVVTPLPPDVTEIGNVAYNPEAGPPDCDSDPMPPNCTEIPTDPRQPMLSIDKQAAPASFEPGGSGTYTLAVHVEEGIALGAGPVDVSDPMPAPLVISGEVIGSDWDCAASTDTEAFCIYIGAYPIMPGDRVGGVITIPFTVSVDADADDNVVNVATVTYGPDQATADADASVVIAGEDSPEPIAVPIDARWTMWPLVLMFLSAGLARLMLNRHELG